MLSSNTASDIQLAESPTYQGLTASASADLPPHEDTAAAATLCSTAVTRAASLPCVGAPAVAEEALAHRLLDSAGSGIVEGGSGDAGCGSSTATDVKLSLEWLRSAPPAVASAFLMSVEGQLLPLSSRPASIPTAILSLESQMLPAI